MGRKKKVLEPEYVPEDTGTHGDHDACCVPKCKNPTAVSYTTSLAPGEKWWFCEEHYSAKGPCFAPASHDSTEFNKFRKKIGMPSISVPKEIDLSL